MGDQPFALERNIDALEAKTEATTGMIVSASPSEELMRGALNAIIVDAELLDMAVRDKDPTNELLLRIKMIRDLARKTVRQEGVSMQVNSVALTQIYEALGVKNQTEAMEKLRALKKPFELNNSLVYAAASAFMVEAFSTVTMQRHHMRAMEAALLVAFERHGVSLCSTT